MPRTTSRTRNRPRSTGRWIAIAAAAVLVTVIGVRIARQGSLPGERYASQGNVHIAGPDADHPPYNTDPPTSGWHVENITPWGSYDRAVPDELVVHNMEDGGVVLWYALGTAAENERNLRALEEIARGYRRVVIAPREGMPTPYALTAWQRLQRFESLDAEAMGRFLDAYEGIDHHPG